MNGFVADGNDINCRECKYGDKCNVGRGHGYKVGSCVQFEVEKKQTNADRIRNMTDEELAKTILADWCSILCPGGSFFCDCECATKITEWLKQEVDA